MKKLVLAESNDKQKKQVYCCDNCGTLEECYAMTLCPSCGYIVNFSSCDNFMVDSNSW